MQSMHTRAEHYAAVLTTTKTHAHVYTSEQVQCARLDNDTPLHPLIMSSALSLLSSPCVHQLQATLSTSALVTWCS